MLNVFSDLLCSTLCWHNSIIGWSLHLYSLEDGTDDLNNQELVPLSKQVKVGQSVRL